MLFTLITSDFQVVTALVASASKSMVNVEPIECCNMLQALAKFNYNPGPEFISEVNYQ
jgi:hypothetical protein